MFIFAHMSTTFSLFCRCGSNIVIKCIEHLLPVINQTNIDIKTQPPQHWTSDNHQGNAAAAATLFTTYWTNQRRPGSGRLCVGLQSSRTTCDWHKFTPEGCPFVTNPKEERVFRVQQHPLSAMSDSWQPNASRQVPGKGPGKPREPPENGRCTEQGSGVYGRQNCMPLCCLQFAIDTFRLRFWG